MEALGSETACWGIDEIHQKSALQGVLLNFLERGLGYWLTSWRAARKSLVECAIESYGKLNKHPQNSLDILSWGVSAELTTEKPVGVPMDLIEKLPV